MSPFRLSIVARLIRIMLRGGGQDLFNVAEKKNRRPAKLGKALLLVFVSVYLGGIMVMIIYGVNSVLAPLGLQQLILSLVIGAGVLMAFIFGSLQVISTLYHAGDVERLLPLPLTSGEIISAKLAVNWIYELIEMAAIVLVPLVVYGILNHQPAHFYIILILIIPLLPLIPLAIAAVLVLLLMRFTRFARDKDRFAIISQLFALALVLGLSLGMQFATSRDDADLGNLIAGAGQSAASLAKSWLPGVNWILRALEAPDLFSALSWVALTLIVAAAALALVYLAASRWYFAGVLSGGAGGSRTGVSADGHTRLDRQTVSVRSPFIAVMIKDTRLMLRSPIYLLNNIVMNFLWPVLLFAPLLFQEMPGGSGVGGAVAAARAALAEGNGAFLFSMVFALAAFTGSSNGISGSALSREGSCFYLLKIIPISYTRQLAAKVSVGLLFGLIGQLIPLVLVLLIAPSPLYAMGALLLVPGALLIPNLAGIGFELKSPKLNWDNEQKAVKQNTNVLFMLLISMFMAGAAFLPLLLPGGSPLLVWAILFAISGAVSLGQLLRLRQTAPRLFAAIEP